MIISRNNTLSRRPKHKPAKLISEKQNVSVVSLERDHFHNRDITHEIVSFIVDETGPNILVYLNSVMVDDGDLQSMAILVLVKWFYY